jgi:hypothetical protein
MKIFCKTVTLFSSGFEHLLSSKLLRNWIVPAWIPRMTATDALQSEPETPGNPAAYPPLQAYTGYSSDENDRSAHR